MSEAIIVALITAAASVFCNFAVMKKTTQDADVKRAVFEQQVNSRLNNIEKKLDIHNGYAEKFGEIQTDIACIKVEMKNLKGE